MFKKGLILTLIMAFVFPTGSFAVREQNDDNDSLALVEQGGEQSGHPMCPKDNKLALSVYILGGTCFATVFATLISGVLFPGITKPATCCDPCMASYKMGGANSLFYCAQNGTGANASMTIEGCPFYAGHLGTGFVLTCSDDKCIEPSFSVSMMKNGTLYCDDLSNDTDILPPLVPATIKSGE